MTEISKIFFGYLNPFGFALVMTIFCILLSIPGGIEQAEKEAKEKGELVMCTKMVPDADIKVDENGLSKYRCFK